MNFPSIGNQTNSIDIVENSTDFFLNELNESLYGSTLAKISFGFMIALNHAIGPVLLLGIVLFEMNGADPQKRNLINILFSLALINLIIFTFLLGGCKLWRQIVGLIEFNTMIVIERVGYIVCTNFILLMDQMTILRYLQIVVWKRVKGLNDGFLAVLCGLTTILWSSTICIIDHIPYEKSILLFQLKMMAGNAPYSIDELQ